MTMGDELLLLALTPGRRRTRVRAPERLRHALRAAELAELALLGRVVVGERRIEVLGGGRLGVPRLDNLLALLAAAQPPPSPRDWLRAAPRSLTAEYLSRAHDQKTVRVRRHRDRVGGTSYDIDSLDVGRRGALVARLAAAVRAASAGGAEAGSQVGGEYAYDVTLAVLAHAAGLGPALHPGLRGLAARRRMAALTAPGEAVAEEASLAYDEELAARVELGIDGLSRGFQRQLSRIYSDMTTGGHGLGHDMSAGAWSDDLSGGGHHGGGHHGGAGADGW
jgi:hypothetical protein